MRAHPLKINNKYKKINLLGSFWLNFDLEFGMNFELEEKQKTKLGATKVSVQVEMFLVTNRAQIKGMFLRGL